MRKRIKLHAEMLIRTIMRFETEKFQSICSIVVTEVQKLENTRDWSINSELFVKEGSEATLRTNEDLHRLGRL